MPTLSIEAQVYSGMRIRSTLWRFSTYRRIDETAGLQSLPGRRNPHSKISYSALNPWQYIPSIMHYVLPPGFPWHLPLIVRTRFGASRPFRDTGSGHPHEPGFRKFFGALAPRINYGSQVVGGHTRRSDAPGPRARVRGHCRGRDRFQLISITGG